MKLTRRQEEFIKKMLELGQEMDGPIHYSVLAKHLGVSPFTAYDMLRLLEEKGLVTSQYQLPAGKSGPGRAERLFYPTQTALEWQRQFAQTSTEALTLEGEAFGQFMLNKIESGEILDGGVGLEMLTRIPSHDSRQISYCMEVMTVVALRLQRYAGYKLVTTYLPTMLPDTAPPTKANLCLLGGFSFGILAEEESEDQEWTRMLFEHVQQYLDFVMMLAPEERQPLGDYLANVFTALE
ncbi:MAG: hypothetical protein GY796_19585 [Chloroflexi bacterium]|nr:hypothetical protein [Chloroflexota bacterium]